MEHSAYRQRRFLLVPNNNITVSSYSSVEWARFHFRAIGGISLQNTLNQQTPPTNALTPQAPRRVTVAPTVERSPFRLAGITGVPDAEQAPCRTSATANKPPERVPNIGMAQVRSRVSGTQFRATCNRTQVASRTGTCSWRPLRPPELTTGANV